MIQPQLSCHLNQKQLADYWGVSQRTLERWRAVGWGPVFLKIGGRVVYRLEDIEAYETNCLRSSTNSNHVNQPNS